MIVDWVFHMRSSSKYLELAPIGRASTCKAGTECSIIRGVVEASRTTRSVSVPALQPYIIEPIWEQFCALLPERKTDHPLGCHRRRIPDRVVFEKLVQILVFGCAYERIADASCSESTLRRRRD